MTQAEFKDILVETGLNVYHNIANQDDGNYIVWNLVGFKYIFSENQVEERNARYCVNYYSKEEYDEKFLLIESVLESHEITFSAPVVVYDPATNITMYSFTVEVGYKCGTIRE